MTQVQSPVSISEINPLGQKEETLEKKRTKRIENMSGPPFHCFEFNVNFRSSCSVQSRNPLQKDPKNGKSE